MVNRLGNSSTCYNKERRQKGEIRMKAVAVIDSFKGCTTSKELNRAVLSKLPKEFSEKVNLPIADGGEGTLTAIQSALAGDWIQVESCDPLGKPLKDSYLITEIEEKKVAIIESARFIGLHLVTPSDSTIQQASSYGLGMVIKDALGKKVQQVYVSLGGSATSDGGLGMLSALGVQLNPKTKVNPLLSVEKLNFDSLLEELQQVEIVALADVTNPYFGEKGFAEVFAKQKGAWKETILKMDQQAAKVAQTIQEQTGHSLGNSSGAGAAGGLGGAIISMGGRIIPGFQAIQEMIGLEHSIKDADLIFTGEGMLDEQTNQGKVPFGVASLAKKYNIPVIALCGSRGDSLGEMEDLLIGAFSIQKGPISLEEALDTQQTLKNIADIASDLAAIFIK